MAYSNGVGRATRRAARHVGACLGGGLRGRRNFHFLQHWWFWCLESEKRIEKKKKWKSKKGKM